MWITPSKCLGDFLIKDLPVEIQLESRGYITVDDWQQLPVGITLDPITKLLIITSKLDVTENTIFSFSLRANKKPRRFSVAIYIDEITTHNYLYAKEVYTQNKVTATYHHLMDNPRPWDEKIHNN